MNQWELISVAAVVVDFEPNLHFWHRQPTKGFLSVTRCLRRAYGSTIGNW